jgi:hypothetical protein
MMPIDRSRFVLIWLAAAIVLLGVGMVLYGAGFHAVASPGAVVAAHAGIDARCAQCHQPAKAATDLRCERCHDPIDSRRLGAPAHAVLGGGGAWPSSHTAEVACVACHTEHGGRTRDLTRVADERCASCHAFSSFRRHPEFALVKAKREPDAGLDFSHEIHLREVAKVGGDRCQACHQPTADGRGFEPIAFDAHCASCHVKNGVLSPNGTDPSKSTALLRSALLQQTPEALMLKGDGGRVLEDERGRVTLQGFAHRDMWILANIKRLTRTIAGPTVAADRRRLSDQAARLSAIAGDVPLAVLSDADLAAWAAALGRDVAALDRQIAAGPSGAPDSAAGLSTVAGAVDPSLAPLISQLSAARPAAPDPGLARAAEPQQVDERRREIEQLLDAVAAHSPGTLAVRAADLKKRLADVKAGDPAAASLDVAAIGDRLNAVEAALRAVEPATSESAAVELRAFADAVRQRMSGGLDPFATATERAQVLALLDAMGTRATPSLRARIAELRAAVMPLLDGGGEGLRARREQKVRLLDRIALERSLRPDGGPAPVDAIANAERTNATRELRLIQAQLAALDRDGASVADVDGAKGKTALKGLFAACGPCHRPSQDETALRPVLAGRPTLTSATFTHKPHLLQAKCESCHASVAKSSAGPDVNLPAVASCQNCHNDSQARADCGSCHRYHPRSAAEMVVAWR